VSGLVLEIPLKAIIATYEQEGTEVAVGGFAQVDLTAVPEGEVWIIEAAAAWNNDHAGNRTSLRINRQSGTNVIIAQVVPTAAKQAAQLYHSVTLFPGDAMSGSFGSTTAGDDLFVHATGLRMNLEVF
jgi:hypothetical protein